LLYFGKRDSPPPLRVRLVHPDASLPTRAHPTDAGLDLATIDAVTLHPGERCKVLTGLQIAIPDGHVGLIADRSSMALCGVKTGGGVIDQGYRGELGVILLNTSNEAVHLQKGDRIAQLLVVPVCTAQVIAVCALSETTRGASGFGSSGK
jgi:dUTP pyrophosphatase